MHNALLFIGFALTEVTLVVIVAGLARTSQAIDRISAEVLGRRDRDEIVCGSCGQDCGEGLIPPMIVDHNVELLFPARTIQLRSYVCLACQGQTEGVFADGTQYARSE